MLLFISYIEGTKLSLKKKHLFIIILFLPDFSLLLFFSCLILFLSVWSPVLPVVTLGTCMIIKNWIIFLSSFQNADEGTSYRIEVYVSSHFCLSLLPNEILRSEKKFNSPFNNLKRKKDQRSVENKTHEKKEKVNKYFLQIYSD